MGICMSSNSGTVPRAAAESSNPNEQEQKQLRGDQKNSTESTQNKTNASASPQTTGATDKVQLYITGFGPFHGQPDNPSMHLVRALDKSTLGILSAESLADTRIVETSIEGVNEVVSDWSANGGNPIFIHIGVNGGAQKVHVERTSYNNATFRIPDMRGNTLNATCIDTNQTLDCSIPTHIDVESVCENLSSETAKSVLMSNDPGRYICNYIYCKSLLSSGGRSVFIHVPNFDKIEKQVQITILSEIIEGIVKQVREHGLVQKPIQIEAPTGGQSGDLVFGTQS